MTPPLRSIFVAALLALPAAAHAQPAGAPPPPGGYYQEPAGPERGGFMIGFGLGAGAFFVVCDGCEDANEMGVAFDFQIGGFLNPNLALMYDVSMVLHPESSELGDYIVTNATNTLAAQTWLTPKLWAKGGLGLGQFQITGDIEESEYGFALTGAAGYDVIQLGNFALDLRLRAGNVFYDGENVTNVSGVVGVNWY